MEKNELFTVAITDMTNEGEGVGKTDGFTWFIKGTVPGDTVRALAMKVKKTYGYARVCEVITPSPDRREPFCPIASPCGGCQLQALSFEAQLKYKENKVLSAMQRIGGFDLSDVETEPVLSMEEPFHYRNKAQYPVSLSKDGRVIAGFYAEHTHSVIECRECLIGAKTDAAVLSAVTAFMEKNQVSPYDEKTGSGVVRHVLIRTSRATGEIMVCPVINADRMPHAEEFVSALREAVPAVSTVCVNVNRDNTNVILGEKTECLYGNGYITDEIGGVGFRISPQSFFQVNPVQVEKLYGKALEYASLTGGETVWDLYCGVGTISLFLARHAGKVLGVEVVPQAVENAKENAELNGIANAMFYTGKAEEVTPLWLLDPENRPSVICVDPPRKGCDEVCLKTILSASPDRIVYVSCDPASLARDLKILADGGYALKKLCPVDMFPHTVHVETVALMTRNGKKMTDREILQEAAEYLKEKPEVTFDPWPDYDPRVMAVLSLGEDPDYLKNHEKLADKAIGEMTPEELFTMYTFITRGERFCDGHIASFIENGALYELVLRHLELLSELQTEKEQTESRKEKQ